MTRKIPMTYIHQKGNTTQLAGSNAASHNTIVFYSAIASDTTGSKLLLNEMSTKFPHYNIVLCDDKEFMKKMVSPNDISLLCVQDPADADSGIELATEFKQRGYQGKTVSIGKIYTIHKVFDEQYIGQRDSEIFYMIKRNMKR